jgi:anaerobic selenocysteine-containing dehydrogenase
MVTVTVSVCAESASPMLTVEEAWMLCAVARSIDPQAYLAVGHVPSAEADESFPGGFTIRAEKCPNRLGVEAVIALFDPAVHTWTDLIEHVREGNASAAWITAGYPTGPDTASWIDADTAAAFGELTCLVVQDLFDSPLAKLATWRLPAAGFAERAGTWVNVAHRAQAFQQAIRPPAGAPNIVVVLLDDVGRKGIFIPEGLGHAFIALTDDAVVSYLVTAPFTAEREHGIDPTDPAIGLAFPSDAGSLKLSPKDTDAPSQSSCGR